MLLFVLAVFWSVAAVNSAAAPDTNETNVAQDFVLGCDNHYYHLMEDYVRAPSTRTTAQYPAQINPLNVTFHLYTRRNPHHSQLLIPGDLQMLNASNFNSSVPTRIIAHGFCNCHHSDFCLETRQMFLYRQAYNVITINWQSGRQLTDYWIARKRIIPVSQQLAKLIDFLHDKGGMNLDDLYLVGHSLGAHLSGLAAKAVTSGTINTIVGLDPAKPLFDPKRPSERLADTDAHYVEVIHTNGGKLGMYEPIGHADFYPNGGVKQPGCWVWWMGSSCSHGRAWEFFAESIVSKVGFWSTRCDSLNQVSPSGCRSAKSKLKMGGDPIAQYKRGVMTVLTKSNSPYAERKVDLARMKKRYSVLAKKGQNGRKKKELIYV